MAKQTFSIGQVLEAADMNALQANDYNWTVDTKTDSYVLVAGDAGKRIVMNAATAKTITVNNSVFTAGDTVWIHNINTGTCTVTAGTATVNTAGSLALAQWEGGILYFTSAASAIFFPAGGVGAANFSDSATGTYSSGGINYKYITYTASGTLTITKAGLADILIVGGGGGGGGGNGGGGAGGHLSITDGFLPVGTLTVTVGAGGTGGIGAANRTAPGLNGNTSRLGSYYSPGGGGGGFTSWDTSTQLSRPGSNGGSGGGAGGFGSGATASGGSGTTGLGNDGGTAAGSPGFPGGGGGGANAAGSNATSTNGGNGGNGTATSLDNVSTTRAGGGGGGSSANTAGTGGTGGGGAGSNSSAAGTNGTANTGGGGGGGGLTGTTWGSGGNGGSGIVIVRVRT